MSDSIDTQEPTTGQKKRWLIRISLLAIVAVGMDQGLQHFALNDGRFMGRRIAPFDPPVFHSGQQRVFDSLERFATTGKPKERSFHMDPDLGWCPYPGMKWGDKHFDWAACRVSSAPLERQRKPELKRILTLGCSFTMGEEVEDHQAWPYMLDERHQEIEFANLAMSAYGIDQALIRYRRDGRPLEGDEVWLGLLPEACMRVASVYRPAQRHWASALVFKPRFELSENEELQLIPCPAKGPLETHALISSQADFFEATRNHDTWVRRVPSAYAPQGSSWLHSSGFARLGLTYMDSRKRNAAAWLTDSGSEVYRLMRAVCLQFTREVEADGARFRLILLPSRGGMESLRSQQTVMWSGLMKDLSSKGVEVVDCTQAGLAADMDVRDECWSPGGHYSGLGNQVIADHLEAQLKATTSSQ